MSVDDTDYILVTKISAVFLTFGYEAVEGDFGIE